MVVKIVHISDTHNQHKGMIIPAGDILIHSGDATGRGMHYEIEAFGEWFRSLPHRHKIFVSGNHDLLFEKNQAAAKTAFFGTDKPSFDDGVHYLQDEEVTVDVDGQLFIIYGSPWQPWFHNWAFNAYAPQLKEIWAKIPDRIDILVTHGPPLDILDRCLDGKRVGCPDLAQAIKLKKPKIHMFGHIHEDNGVRVYGETTYSNAAMLDLNYRPNNTANIFEVSDDGKVLYVSP
jgi:hypothetical protein